jgi:hypothetical protein
MWPPVEIVTGVGVAKEICPVKSTSEAVYGDGGTKKSVALVTVPNGVETDSRPEPALAGTVVSSVVVVAVVIAAMVLLKRVTSFADVVSKLVPLIATAVPGAPIDGVNPEIVGAPVKG